MSAPPFRKCKPVQLVCKPVCDSSAPQYSRLSDLVVIMTVMSILSAATTGPWSRLGDSVGRKPILFTCLIGALSLCAPHAFQICSRLSDIFIRRELVFVLVTLDNSFIAAYAKQFLLLGFIIDGAVGGLSAFNGVVHAYV